jgi:hypothetical protein
MEIVPTPPPSPEQQKREDLWNQYLLKCCEVGQMLYQLETFDSQRLDLQKKLEVVEKSRNKAARDHDEYLKQNDPKLNITPKKEEPAIELNETMQ